MTTLLDAAPPAATTAAGARPLVIGLDIALVNSGVAGPGWTDHIRTGKQRGEERLCTILSAARSFYRSADMVVIEGASFGSALQAGHDEMAAARWMIRTDLHRRGIPFAVVPPHNRTVYALGDGQPKDIETRARLTSKQAKALVRDAVAERYGVDCEGTTRYDQADAYVLMAMGLDWLGYALAQVPDSHSRALKTVPWPVLTPAVSQ